MTLTLHGIPGCDTVKRARAWLDAAGIGHDFHDYKRRGIAAETLRAWAGEVGWQRLLNRSGTTFRGLTDAERADLDEAKALALMGAHPSLIKRPVVTGAGPLLVGFSPESYAAALSR